MKVAGRRPKVMHVISGLRTGGAEHALLRIIQGGTGEAFDTHVVSLETEGTMGQRMRAAGAGVHMLDAAKAPLKAWSRLGRITGDIEPDLIQGWMYHGNLGALAARRAAPGRPPVLFNIRHGLDDLKAEKPSVQAAIALNRHFSRAPARILYNSHRSRDQHQAFGFAADRGEVIPNGFELDRFTPDATAREQVRGSLGLGPDALLIGHFARLHPMKDHIGLVRALDRAMAKGLDAHVMMSGTGVSPATVRLNANVDPARRGRFHIFDNRTDVPAMMQAVDIYISSSSRGEGFPNVLGEAMASSRACITTDVGDSARILGETGLVVPPSHPEALAEAVLELGGNRDRIRALGLAARRRMEDHFSLEAAVTRYVDLYRSTLAPEETR